MQTEKKRAAGRHNPYFDRLNSLMRAKGPGHPVLVLDLDILDRNIDELKNLIGSPERFRLVVKSLPSLALIRYILERTGTAKLMVFHRPFLNLAAAQFPQADILLGKPLPVQAFRTYFHVKNERFPGSPDKTVQWLIDTPERLHQYRDAARALGKKIRVNIEIDVGLHRGGVPEPALLAPMLKTINEDPMYLDLSGFMGYDPHVARSGKLFIPRSMALAQVTARYRKFIRYLQSEFPALYHPDLTFNGAGSPTYALYRKKDLLNDLSVGSALVKPANFDLRSLKGHRPALFIATPLLKKSSGVRIPFLGPLSGLLYKVKPAWRTTLFIYGGYWKAVPLSPAGLVFNTLYGRSSNQEMLNGPEAVALEVDDYVFLRPAQSEAVMLQFGDLFVVRGDQYVGRWPVFTQGD